MGISGNNATVDCGLRSDQSCQRNAGLRPGELSELRWGDRVATARKLTISRSYDEKAQKVGPPKSGEPRDVPIHPYLAKLLDLAFARRTMALDRAPAPNELIAQRNGQHRWLKASMLRRFRWTLARLGIESPTKRERNLKTGRHSFVTLLRAAGGDRDVVQSFTHATDETERFRNRSAFAHYDHSHLDWGVALDTIELLRLEEPMEE